MKNNLAEILSNLQQQSKRSNCAVCTMACEMDSETKDAFIDVMRSTVTIRAIVDALNAEGIKISRFQLGEARRECIKSNKECETFKGGQK